MYNTTLRLNDNEVPARLDKETGEVLKVDDFVKKNNIPDGKERVIYHDFSCVNTLTQKVCIEIFSNEELGVIYKMIAISDFNSNTLVPLNDESSYRFLSENFGIPRRKVEQIFKKLFDWGVYAHVRVANGELSEYWVLNPFLSYKGKLMDSSLSTFFAQTKLSKLIK
jgi:hypothetical protein